jgi:hypothetical protein
MNSNYICEVYFLYYTLVISCDLFVSVDVCDNEATSIFCAHQKTPSWDPSSPTSGNAGLEEFVSYPAI